MPPLAIVAAVTTPGRTTACPCKRRATRRASTTNEGRTLTSDGEDDLLGTLHVEAYIVAALCTTGHEGAE